MKKYKLSLFSYSLNFSCKVKDFICKKDGVMRKRGAEAEVFAYENFLSDEEGAKFFLGVCNTEQSEPFLCAYILRSSALYDDLLGCMRTLPFCENFVLILSDDEKILSKNAAETVSEYLKTYVICHNLKHSPSSLRKQLFAAMEEQKTSGYQKYFTENVSGFSKGVAKALYQKNPALAYLAPHLTSADKPGIEKISAAVGIDLLDNIKILKELCIALELLKLGAEDKKYALAEVKMCEKRYAEKICETVCERM